MAYDIALERRIDRLAGKLGPLTKKRMFGGIGYLVEGNMCFGLHKEWLVVRMPAEKAEEMLKSGQAVPFSITGRTMKGWIQVSAGGLKTDDRLMAMLRTGLEFARDLPKDKK
jgi:TfoX/Sxy family transcriptional regulator of competence genes